MTYFDENNPKNRKKINRMREESFDDTREKLKKRIIANAIIDFDPDWYGGEVFAATDFDPGDFWDLDSMGERHIEEKNTMTINCEVCIRMRLFVDKKIYAEVETSGKKENIEKSIRLNFIKHMQKKIGKRERIKKLEIFEIGNKLGANIAPDPDWLKSIKI